MKNFSEFAIRVPQILLPADKDLSTWSVIACDQYTQDEEYWKKASLAAGNRPSTLNLILPEVYLASEDKAERIHKIHAAMDSYLKNGVFEEPQEEFVYVERRTSYGRLRKGLVCAVDLEAYEWKPMSHAPIRATEATIVERIPPRRQIRQGAPLESPHIMLLANDPKGLLVESCGGLAKNSQPVYDGDLMLDGGHITGWALRDERSLDAVYDALLQLKNDGTCAEDGTFLFAVGDGNHSLATAKAVWDEYRETLIASGAGQRELDECPARYALVEIVNIFDGGLTFEPIHRVLFNAEIQDAVTFASRKLGGRTEECGTEEELERRVASSSAGFGFVYSSGGRSTFLFMDTDIRELAVSRMQPVLDEYMEIKNSGGGNVQIDYIHGSGEVFRLGKKEGVLTVLMPPIAKDSFFATIRRSGPLPRKSFSMGEASEKRFYLECRRLFES